MGKLELISLARLTTKEYIPEIKHPLAKPPNCLPKYHRPLIRLVIVLLTCLSSQVTWELLPANADCRELGSSCSTVSCAKTHQILCAFRYVGDRTFPSVMLLGTRNRPWVRTLVASPQDIRHRKRQA